MPRSLALLACIAAIFLAANLFAQTPPASTESHTSTQAEREAALTAMLSGATLEGSFTDSGRADANGASAKLTKEKYTLGEVKKVDADKNLWLFPTRIQYADKDFPIPLTLPIEWAGDTPVVVVDNVGMPGLGTFSARVLFFNDHYAGYWQHGEKGGNLFGRIHPANTAHRAKLAPAKE
jgi:hypothetical protein